MRRLWRCCCETPDLDAVLVIHAPAAGIDPGEVATAVAATADRRKPRSSQRPVLAAWLGEIAQEPATAALDQAAIPVFRTPEAAVRAFLYRVQHEQRQFVLRQIPTSRPDSPLDRQRAASLIDPALAAGRRSLNEADAMALLDAYAIPSVPTRVVADLDAAAAAARELGYPVALKIVSPQLPQKSSVGGVALDIVDKASLLRRGRHMLDAGGRQSLRARRSRACWYSACSAPCSRSSSISAWRPTRPSGRCCCSATPRCGRLAPPSPTSCRRWTRPWPTPCSTRRRSAAF